MHFLTTRIKSFKRYFLISGVVKKTRFHAFPSHQNQVLIKDVFQRLECLETCFNAFPGHQNQVLRKDIFQRLSRQKRVLMHFQATGIKSLKKIFFNVWIG
jgi:hypothetical protein